MKHSSRPKYYRLVNKRAVPVAGDDVMVWAREFERGDKRRVDETRLPGGVRVSTVFLGLDHAWDAGPPLIFETMIFGGKHDEYQERYSTWKQAVAGHAKAVELAKSAL